MFFRTIRTDILNFTINSGVNHVGGRFLGLFDMPTDSSYWGKVRDQEGLWGAALIIIRRGPSMVITNAVGLAMWLVFLSVSVVGIHELMHGPHRQLVVGIAVIILGFLVFSFASDVVCWSHRAPAEFTLVIGFAAGLFPVMTRVRHLFRRTT